MQLDDDACTVPLLSTSGSQPGGEIARRPLRSSATNGTYSRFEISLDVVNGQAVVGVVGDVDAATAPELDAIARKLCEQRHPLVVLDLSRVGFIDAAGLRVINQTAHRLGEQTGSLRLRSPSAFTARLLELVGMAALIEPEVTPGTGDVRL